MLSNIFQFVSSKKFYRKDFFFQITKLNYEHFLLSWRVCSNGRRQLIRFKHRHELTIVVGPSHSRSDAQTSNSLYILKY